MQLNVKKKSSLDSWDKVVYSDWMLVERCLSRCP